MDREGDLVNLSASPEAAALAPAFKVFAEEGFLLTLTNRGVYNRSRRDYDALTDSVTLSAEEGRLAVNFGDVKVILDRNIAQSRCSCPAGTTCRHIVMALFAAEELARQQAAVETEQAADFSELEQISLETLKKEGGKKNYEAALNFLREDFEVEFSGGQESGEMLAIYIEAFDITVYFPREESIGASVCKCGEKGLCLHRLIAILAFQKERELIDLDAEFAAGLNASTGTGISFLSLLENARAYTGSLIDKGLMSADDTDIEGARQLSLKLEGAGIGNLSRLFRSAATDMENMGAKNAAFDPTRTFSTLSRIYTTISLILARPEDTERRTALIEKSRSVYRTLPLGHFIGLGAHPWQTRSGYAGVTVLVFHNEKNVFRTYTVSMADFYEGTQSMTNFQGLKSLMTSTKNREENAHWDTDNSLQTISRSAFTLRNFKLNDEGRLSSSRGTHYSFQGKTTLEKIDEMKDSIVAESSPVSEGEIEKTLVYDYFEKNSGRKYRFAIAESITNCEYDRVNQKLTFTINSGGDGLPAFISYSAINKGAIKYIEALAKMNFTRRCFIGETGPQGFIPLSMITCAGVENFYFSAPPKTDVPETGTPEAQP
ncbi:SWIM zinc finger family protein [Leadbettera azotonutricia]|uniref:SWIM zinc finger family protein n=1 Tax=Leadbettera azotonutricia TaxID=150829 RepID=UPI0005C6ACA3|nr:SWIM zinc finger family protein [Leadbettera azotonutricia]